MKEAFSLLLTLLFLVSASWAETYDVVLTMQGMPAELYEKAISQSRQWVDYVNFGIDSELSYDIGSFYTYEEIESLMRGFASHEIADVDCIGKSVQGRNIYSIRIGYGSRYLLVCSGLQARETAGTSYLLCQLCRLVNDYENDDEETMDLLSQYTVIAVPCANPDGRAMLDEADNADWRANANGVDLSVNFPASCAAQLGDNTAQAARATEPGKADYAGPYLGSEPETQTLIAWLDEYIDDADALLIYDQYGRQVIGGASYLSEKSYALSTAFAQDVAVFLSGINSGYTAAEQYTGMHGWGSGTLADYACEIAEGLCFSDKYGLLGMQYAENDIVPLSIYQDIDEHMDLYAPRNDHFACITVKISTKGGASYYDNARKNHEKEYENCCYGDLLIHCMNYLSGVIPQTTTDTTRQ